jgi:hypothetical protein
MASPIFLLTVGEFPADAAALLDLMPLECAYRLALHLGSDLRRHVRDRALRELRRARYSDLKACPAAKEIARALDAERTDPKDDEALRRIIVLDRGRALRWRAIAAVLD